MADEKKPLLSSADLAAISSAASGEGVVPVTPSILHSVCARVKEEQAKIDTIQAAWEAIPYDARLTAATYIIQKIAEHGREPGSFRFLIYDRLGFGPDAYVPLYLAGGMEITNNFGHDEDDTARG